MPKLVVVRETFDYFFQEMDMATTPITPDERARWLRNGGAAGWGLDFPDPQARAIDDYIRHRWRIGNRDTPLPEGHLGAVRLEVILNRLNLPLATVIDRATSGADWIGTPAPSPVPPGGLAPLKFEDWRGDFLYPAAHFFGPRAATHDPSRGGYFASLRALGYTHVLINAHQTDWDARYTKGGYWAYDRRDHFRDCLRQARAFGLSPIIGVLDRGQDHDIARTVTFCNDVLGEWGDDCIGLWPLWEADELTQGSDEWLRWQIRLASEVDWGTRHRFFIHTARVRKGGIENYSRIGDAMRAGHRHLVVRAEQYPADWPALPHEETGQESVPDPHIVPGTRNLQRSTELVAEVANLTGTAVCAAEHSSPFRQGQHTYTQAQAARRAGVCLDVLHRMLPPERRGSLNG